MTDGPYTAVYDFECCYMPYTNPVNGQSKPLRYWILWPNNFNAETEYPLLVHVPGSYIDGQGLIIAPYYGSSPSSASSVLMHRSDIAGSPYFTHEAIVIIPDMLDHSEWSRFPSSYDGNFFYNHLVKGGHYFGIWPLKELIEKLKAKTTVFYDTDACDTIHSELQAHPTVDANRIYFAGYSCGGGAAWRIMLAMRDVFAGLVMNAGWPIGQPYSDMYLDNYKVYKEILKKQVRRIHGIPVLFCGGEFDPMYYKSTYSIEKAFTDVETELGLTRNVYFAMRPNAHHNSPVYPDAWDSEAEQYSNATSQVAHNNHWWQCNTTHTDVADQEPGVSEYWDNIDSTWEVGKEYAMYAWCRHYPYQYFCINPHTSQEGDTPDVSTNWKKWTTGAWGAFTDKSLKFDMTNHSSQLMVTESGENLTNALDWLFSQTRQELDDDPYPDIITEDDFSYVDYHIANASLGLIDNITVKKTLQSIFEDDFNDTLVFDYSYMKWYDFVQKFLEVDIEILIEKSNGAFILNGHNLKTDGELTLDSGFRLRQVNTKVYLWTPVQYLVF